MNAKHGYNSGHKHNCSTLDTQAATSKR